jgi:serine/threonine-protein kinase
MKPQWHATTTVFERTKRCFLAGGTVVLCLSVPASATSGETDKVAAQALFEEGRGLMEAGDFTTACDRLRESQRLDPAVGTLLYLGECLENAGLPASAWAAFRSAESAAGNAKQLDREKVARERAAALEAMLPRLVIVVPDRVRVTGLQVARDGVTVTAASWGVAIPVDPGTHHVEVSAPGKAPWRVTVQIGRGSATETVTLPELEDLRSSPEPGAVGSVAPPRPAVSGPGLPRDAPSSTGNFTDDGDNESPMGSQRWIGIAAAGAGFVALGVGAVYASGAKDKEAQADDLCPNTRCTDPRAIDLTEEAQQAATIANVSFAVAAIGLLGGVVLYTTAPDEGAIPTQVAIGADLNGFLVQGIW